MPLSKVNAKLDNIDRVVDWGNRDSLELIDRETKEVLATVRLWNWRRLNPIQEGAPTYHFILAQDTDTAEILPTCGIAFNGLIHDIKVRDRPQSVTDIQWHLKTLPTNERIDL